MGVALKRAAYKRFQIIGVLLYLGKDALDAVYDGGVDDILQQFHEDVIIRRPVAGAVGQRREIGQIPGTAAGAPPGLRDTKDTPVVFAQPGERGGIDRK